MVELCVISTEPNALAANIHNQILVLVAPEERDVWLYGTADEARHVLRPYDP